MMGRGSGMGRGGMGGGAGFGRAMRAERQPSLPPELRRRTARRIVAFFEPYRAQVVVVLVAILTTSFLGLINPILLKLLIDEVITGRNFDRLNLYVG
jgi:ATP-binding cassette subfamily B protein